MNGKNSLKVTIAWRKRLDVVEDLYLNLKDNNDNPDKESRSVYAEAMAAIYNPYKNQ